MDKKTKNQIKYTGAGIIKVLIGFVVALPVFYCLGMAFMTPAEITDPTTGLLPKSFLYLDNFKTVFGMVDMGRYMINSLIIALLGTAGRVMDNSVHRSCFRYRILHGRNHSDGGRLYRCIQV